ADHLAGAGVTFGQVRLLAVATSPYPTALHERVTALFPAARVLTAYGLTETTIDSTAGHTGPSRGGPAYPIGAPLPGTACLVLDERGRPVPRGIPGELLIGGPGVARGYPTRPDLTA